VFTPVLSFSVNFLALIRDADTALGLESAVDIRELNIDSQLSAMELLINSDFILPDSFKAPKCTAGIYWFSKTIQSANGDLYYDLLHGQCGKLFLTMRLHSLS
jgi:hypothetical protein